MITTQKDLRRQFWLDFPELERRPGSQNQQVTDTRVAWCDYVEAMRRGGWISEQLAERATL